MYLKLIFIDLFSISVLTFMPIRNFRKLEIHLIDFGYIFDSNVALFYFIMEEVSALLLTSRQFVTVHFFTCVNGT